MTFFFLKGEEDIGIIPGTGVRTWALPRCSGGGGVHGSVKIASGTMNCKGK